MTVLKENTTEWYWEITKAGQLFNEWTGDPSKEPLPEEIVESLRKVGWVKKLPTASRDSDA